MDIHAETLRGYVMHDLGELAAHRKTPPQLKDARNLTAARGTDFGVPSDQWEGVAKAAIRDWRATHRAGELPETSPLGKAYVQNSPKSGELGARVIVDLAYPNGKPPGAKMSASIVVNASPLEAIGDIVARAMQAWNDHTLQEPKDSNRSAVAVAGRIVQVVEGGFAHAQI